MSYDLIAFDPALAPRDRHDFLDWISRAFRSMDGPLGSDPARLSIELQGWHAELRQVFPSAGDPHAFAADTDGGSKNAAYRFAQHAVQASFEWSNAGPAMFRARKIAQAHRVGLFEASGADCNVWMVSNRGRFEIVHSASEHRARV